MSEAKEGIVLDRDGNAIFEPAQAAQNGAPRIHVLRGGWGLAALLGVGIPIFLVAGLVILGVFLAVFILLWLVRALFGGGRTSARGGAAFNSSR